MRNAKSTPALWSQWITAHGLCCTGVFLVFALTFVLPSGYSYGAALLLLCAFAGLVREKHLAVTREDALLAGTFLLYFLVSAWAAAWHAEGYEELDQPIRSLLVIPVLLWMLRTPYPLPAMWSGVILGICGSAALGAWQLHIQGIDRAAGYLNIIHFGNIALVFGVLCIAGIVWTATGVRHARTWRVAFLVGILCSGYSVIASGSRSSWVALPFMLLVFCISFLDRQNLARVLGTVAAFLIVATVLFQLPDSRLKARYDAAVHDIILLTQEGETDTSIGARLVMWQGAVKNIAKHPWLGQSYANYNRNLEELAAQGELDPIAVKYGTNLHNGYLQAFAFQGLPGLIALLLFFMVPLTLFGRRLRAPQMEVRVLAYAGASLAVAYVIFSLTQVILRRNNGIMIYLLFVTILWAGLRRAERSA